MMQHKKFLVLLFATGLLAGCGGEGDDVTIVTQGGAGAGPGTGGGGGGRSCTAADVSPQPFVVFDSANCTATLTGDINIDYTLGAAVEWRIEGTIRVGDGNKELADAAAVAAVKQAGVTLTIEPGAHIRAFGDGSLLVTRGSRIMAAGTAAAPITFSSVVDADFDGEGEWGGVIIQGFAPQYGQGGTGACYGSGSVCNVEGEGGTAVALYGGNAPADNSGVLRYVRIAEGGKVEGPDNEINGLTLQGVGHGTTIEYVQVHNNLDDGVEWFGGTVNARYLVLTNNDDDDIDFDEGYKGNVQHVLVRKHPAKATPTGKNDPRGIEANSSDDEYVPETDATLANVLLLGSSVSGNEPAMRLRGALTVRIYNSAIAGFKDCIRIDDADTDGLDSTPAEPSAVTLVNITCDNMGALYSHEMPDSTTKTATNVAMGSWTVNSRYALPASAGDLTAAPTITAVDNGSGFTFDATDYMGAVDPATTVGNAWWQGWTIPGSLD